MTEQRNRRSWALAQLGRTLGGRYRIDALRGTGGMGAVFEGTHLHVDRKVAIKLLYPESSSDAEALQREAKHAASIPGHGVVAITDFDFTDDGAFLVMELLQGRSLAERLREGVLSEAETRAVVGDVLETLDAVHTTGLVHGDLKPSNVFLSDDGSTKLLDFGVARSIGHEDGRVRGTPAYMAPEQLKGRVDPRADLYAVGALAYEALTGQRPYAEANSSGAVVDALRRGPPTPLAQLGSLHARTCAWVERAMAREPSARFESAPAMLDAIDASEARTSGAPVAASAFREAVNHTESPAPERPKWMPIAGGLTLLLVLAIAGAVVWPSTSAEPTSPSNPAPPNAPLAHVPVANGPPPTDGTPPPSTAPQATAPAELAPIPPGTRVLAPFGPRFVFPGTVVASNGDAVRVVFADGDVTTIPRVDVVPDRLSPGACVLRRERRSGVQACITQRVQHAVRVTSARGPGWTSIMHLFADPSTPATGLTAFEPPPDPGGTHAGARVWARYAGGREDYVAVVVERDVDESGPRARVVYFDGDSEWLSERELRPFSLPPGAAVRAAPRRTSVVDPDVGPATVQQLVGDAVLLVLQDGRQAWVGLSQIAVRHPTE